MVVELLQMLCFNDTMDQLTMASIVCWCKHVLSRELACLKKGISV